MQGYVEDLWTRTRLLRIGFIAGLIVGLFAGWFFHGVISLIIRFFFVIVLLIPFAIALVAWWRLRRQMQRFRTGRDEDEGAWAVRPVRPRGPADRRWSDEAVDAGPVITVESWETRDRAERRATRDLGTEE
jgi:hypothetical protein